MTALPKKLHFKNGGYYYVHQNVWHNLGRDRSDALKLYEEVRILPSVDVIKQRIDSYWVDAMPLEVKRYLDDVFWRSRRNARNRGILFGLEREDFDRIVRESKGRCAVSGLPFSMAQYNGSRNRPFAPSLDRIDSRGHYTPENCRLVCFSVNMAMSNWGEDVLRKVAAAIVTNNPGITDLEE